MLALGPGDRKSRSSPPLPIHQSAGGDRTQTAESYPRSPREGVSPIDGRQARLSSPAAPSDGDRPPAAASEFRIGNPPVPSTRTILAERIPREDDADGQPSRKAPEARSCTSWCAAGAGRQPQGVERRDG